MLSHPAGILTDLHHIAGGHNQDIFLGNSHGKSNGSVCHQMTVLSVHRKGKAGMKQRVNQLNLLLTCMARYMGILGNHLYALHGQLVNYLGNSLFIARNRRGA